MNTTAIDTARRALEPRPAGDETLNACREVEGVFMGLLLKEGLKPLLDNGGENSANSAQLMEYAIEEAAREIGRQGGVGMADSLYEQLTLGR